MVGELFATSVLWHSRIHKPCTGILPNLDQCIKCIFCVFIPLLACLSGSILADLIVHEIQWRVGTNLLLFKREMLGNMKLLVNIKSF